MDWRKFIKKILKYSGRTLECFVAFLFFYLVVVIYGEAIPVGELKDSGDLHIYVRSNGVHTDICLPVCSETTDWDEFIPIKDFDPNGSFDYITIGWGDKGFFLDTPTWADLKVSTALNAAVLPSSSAMHVAYSEEPGESKNVRKVYISKRNYKRLVRYVKRSFRLSGDKVDIIPGRGYTKSDNFYEAHDSYHLFRTCNIWTNEALKSAGVKTGVFALFPNGILSHLK